MSNQYASTLSIKIWHPSMSEARFTNLMKRIAKSAKGRSGRAVSVLCGKEEITLGEK